MKLKYIFSGLVASTMMLASCVEVDEPNFLNGVGTQQLNVKGLLVVGSNNEYPSIVDPENGTITVQVPYYISDVEPIMPDLTQMKLEASMPVGYSFSPSLSGIHDLTQGYRTNLINEHGKSTSFTIYAEAVKSSASSVVAAKLIESERTAVVIKEPETAGAHGQIIVAKTSSSIDGALHEVLVTVSPWATLSSTGLDEVTGLVDFSERPTVTVTAQNGVDKTTYDVIIQEPEVLTYGVGYIANLFGYQLYTDNEYGFEKNNNTTLAVVNDYLIVSNHKSAADMIVLDRYKGTPVDVKVNTSGMPADRQFKAICHDEANHLIAAAWYTNMIAPVTPESIEIYAWKDGITNPPTCILKKATSDAYCAPIMKETKSWEMFYTVNCRGNICSGDCAISTANLFTSGGAIIFQFKDGVPDGNAFHENAGGTGSQWSSSSVVLTTNKAPYGYLTHSGNFRANTIYAPVGTGKRAFDFQKPKIHFWGQNTHGIDYIEFNGMCLVGLSEGNDATGATSAQRLWVSNITTSPSATSLNDGFIFDSREGNRNGTADIAGTGYAPTGMTSAYSYVSGKTVLGDNWAASNRSQGDVKFARSADGNAVQVYMITPDQGLIGYEITRYDI